MKKLQFLFLIHQGARACISQERLAELEEELRDRFNDEAWSDELDPYAREFANDFLIQSHDNHVSEKEITEPPIELDSGFQGYFINEEGEREYFHKGKVRKTKMKVKDFSPRKSKKTQRSREPGSGDHSSPPLLAQRSIQRDETLSPIRTDSRPFPADDLDVDFDPFDLRKDLVVPLFNFDRTSLNEMIELDKPITLDDVERHFSLDYNFDDLPPILTDDREYAENFTVFERFLGQENDDVEIVIIDGKEVEIPSSFPMPVKRPSNAQYAQRQILAPRNVIEHYSGADKVFQDTIFQQRGIPPMNGYYLIIFTYDNKYGTLSMNLNSTTKGKDSQKELFNGKGKQTVDGQDFTFQILNGKVTKEGVWQMDVIFDKGISFSYFGDTQDGWYLEGCFTCIDCEKIKENCWGSGHLIPKQHTMTEAVQVLTDSAVGHFQIPEGVILTEQATKKYSQKLDRFLKVLADFGSMKNVNGEERAKGFFSAPSKLFYNDFFSVRKLVKGVLQFAVERFQNKPSQVNKVYKRMQRKVKSICQFGIDCPMDLL